MINFTETLPTPQSDLRTKQHFLIFSIITAGKKASSSNKKTSDLTLAQADFEIWKQYAKQ